MCQLNRGDDEFRPNAVGALHSGSTTDIALASLAEKIYQSRRDRDKRSPVSGLFQDPAWDILLDLFVAQARGKHISITSAATAGLVPPTTALRWVWALEEAKLVTRVSDGADKRRSFVVLTTSGNAYMRDVLGAISDRMRQPDTL